MGSASPSSSPSPSQASSFSSASSPHKQSYQYHVFLSFRGEDTRKNFTDHLYTALLQAGFLTFRDDDSIPRGENISLSIQTAIRRSKVSLVVLSKDYASSRWCLDELVDIMELRKITSGAHVVVPVFYDVGPAELRELSGRYGEAFRRHVEVFEVERVDQWKAALVEVAHMDTGLVLQDRYQSQFIQQIIREVGSKLNREVLNVAPYLVGIDSRVADINSWLQDGSNNVGIATIYGVGGIGKTTIAKTVYNQNFDKFEGSSFLANVRENSELPDGLVRLQRQLLSDLVKVKVRKIYNSDEGILRIKDVVCRRRVLLILDDVDQLEQFNAIIGMREWFFPGSKIIITTRFERLLRSHQVSKMFRVEELDDKESLQLFSWHAFGQDHPVEGYMDQAKSAVQLCCGLPLALQVLGSSLSGKSVEAWTSALQKLEAIPDSKIQAILRVSYDSLPDDHDKSIFLDIACFFTGMDRDYVVSVIDGCGLYAVVGIHNLIDRCLLTMDNEKKLMMHQLLRDMGREIVRQESPDDPGKRSRLWHHKDAFDVLNERMGTEMVKGLTLNMQVLKENSGFVSGKMCDCEDSADKSLLCWQGKCSKAFTHGFSLQNVRGGVLNYFMNLKMEAFATMNGLKLLNLNYATFRGDYGNFPKSLIWLCWRGYPTKCIPNSFHLERLVVLDMRNSSLVHLWKGIRFLVELKILNLSHSHGLIKTPDVRGLPSLERLKLKDCTNLVEIDKSIGCLKRLVSLNLKNCKKLKKLPGTISLLESLKVLNLSGCSKLLPMEIEKLESRRAHHQMDNFTNQSSSSVAVGSSFWSLLLPKKNPESIAFTLAVLPCYLVDLYLGDCNISDVTIPKDLSCLQTLEHLDLRGNPIHSLPESIKSLTTLQYLCLDKCTGLQSLPELPMSLEELKAEGCTSLEKITNLPNLLRTMQAELFGCDQLVEVEGLFKLNPIANVDAEMINDLGLSHLAPLGSMELIMFSAIANREMFTPPQVLLECGILSTFLPGNEVPAWFVVKAKGSLISFELCLVPDHTIRGMNLCVVYAHDQRALWLTAHGLYAIIHNETTGIHWAYSPTFYGIPEGEEGMMWLSHWKFGDRLEAGDQLNVSIHMPSGFYVKECGICTIYEQKDVYFQSNAEGSARSASLWDGNISDRDLGMYQVGTTAYYLHHNPSTTPEELLKLKDYDYFL